MKKLTAILITLCIFASALPLSAATAQTVEQTIRALGIISGDEHGNMNLDDNVTRAQFAKMMIAGSAMRDSVGTPHGSSPFSDVKASHWASEYIKSAVQMGWLVGYVDGTFRPDGNIKTEEAATAVLRMLGYTQADLQGVYPAPQMAKYQSLGLSSGVSASQGQTMTRRDCMYLFYNLMTAKTAAGLVYASTIGYTVTPGGEIDYSSLVETRLKGPFVAQSTDMSALVPFTPAEIYRAGTLSESRTLELYDVVYYHEQLRTVWIYTSRASGLYTAAAPNTESPASVTVGGVTYQISTSAAAYKLSAMGEYSIGDEVTLLLGRNGHVVDVLGREQSSAVFYGVFTGKSETTFVDASGKTQSRDVAKIFCTDGIAREFPLDSGSFTLGLPVRVTVENGHTTITRAGSDKLISGKVSSSGGAIGEHKLASSLLILDADKTGAVLTLYPARIAGYTLDSSDIRFYALNEKGEISHLILNDVTGDLATYGILTSAVETETKQEVLDNLSYTYKSVYSYMIDGVPGTYTTDAPLHFKEGPARLIVSDKTLEQVIPLKAYTVDEVAQAHVISGGSRFTFGDGMQVYMLKDGKYTLTELRKVEDLKEYDLTCYIDSYAAGSRVRIIVAKSAA